MRTFVWCKTKRIISPCNFFSHVWASCDLVFPRVVMIQLYDYIRKPFSPFSNISKSDWFLMLYSVYCNVCVLIHSSENCWKTCRWWPCLRQKCVFGLQRLDNSLELFEVQKSLGTGAQKLFGQKWKKLETNYFYFLCFGENCYIVSWNELFLYVTWQDEVLSYCTFTETFANVFQNCFRLKTVVFDGFD